MQLINHYDAFSDQTNTLMDSAKSYAAKGDYEFAVVFLDEAFQSLNELKPKFEKHTHTESNPDHLLFNIISGVDYNRQEFELGLDQSDSTLLDEISKPFVGFDLKYFFNSTVHVADQLKYDREYFVNELNFETIQRFNHAEISINPGHILSYNSVYNGLSFSEFFVDLNLKSTLQNSPWYWSVKNISRFKKYSDPQKSIPDFFRNLTNIYASYSHGVYKSIQFDYTLDYNESIKFDNNDFSEHLFGAGYQNIIFSDLKYKLSAHYRYSRFNYLISDVTNDSLFSNISQNFIIESGVIYNLNSLIDLNFDAEFLKKYYKNKTEQEPDYRLVHLNPFITLNLSDNIVLRSGYVYENKSHQTDGLLEKQYARDQDYYSRGFSAGFDYSGLSDIFFSLNLEYMQRRYPSNGDNPDPGIYSDRDIFNVMLFAQLPLSEKISLNAIASYDNDKDVDRDFNDIISSFFTLELKYSF